MADRNIGVVADEALAIQKKIDKKKQDIEALEVVKRALHEELRHMAEKENLTSGGGKKSKFSIVLETVPQVSDWDKFCAFIKEKDYFHLIQRRPGVKACQELWGLGTAIPGIEKFSHNKVNVKGV